jgi:anti-sigma factor RsiW
MTWFGKPNNKTEHQYFEERLSAYLDGELAPRERDAVERHVATCQACQWDLDTLRQTVEWMRELPTVPIPRVFTIPVPAQPERVPQRRWRLVPVLQAATALVALLLVFAVSGDFLLGGFRMGYAPETLSMQEPPAATVEATIVVEVVKEVEAPVAEGETVVEKMVVETVEVEIEMPASTATPLPQATAAPAPAEPTLGEATQAAAAAPEGEENALAAEEAEKEALPAEPPADETARAAAPAPAAGGAPTPTEMATVSPTQVAAYAAPTLLAEGQEQADVLAAEQERAPARTLLGPGINWLRVAEIVLAVVFLLLMTATIVFTVQRRRAR